MKVEYSYDRVTNFSSRLDIKRGICNALIDFGIDKDFVEACTQNIYAEKQSVLDINYLSLKLNESEIQNMILNQETNPMTVDTDGCKIYVPFVIYVIESANVVIQHKDELCVEGLKYKDIIELIKKHYGINKENREYITQPERNMIKEHLFGNKPGSYVNRVPDVGIIFRHILWLIEKYMIKDTYKAEMLTPLFFAVSTPIPEVKEKKITDINIFNKYFPDYMINYWEYMDYNDSECCYYDRIFGHNQMIDALYKSNIIDLRPQTWGDTVQAKSDCLKLAYYLKGFEITLKYEINKFLKKPDISQVRSAERADNNSVAIAKILYDTSLALDYHFLESCNECINLMSWTIYKIRCVNDLLNRLTCMGHSYDAAKLTEALDSIFCDAPVSSQAYTVIQSFYMYVRMLEFKAQHGLIIPDKKDNNAFIEHTKFLSFELSEEDIIELYEQSVKLTFTDDRYKDMDLVPEDAETEEDEHFKPKIFQPKAHCDDVSDSNDSIKVYDVGDAFLDNRIVRRPKEPDELIEYYEKHKRKIKAFLLACNTEAKISKDNLSNNKKNVFFLIQTVAGNYTDGLTVYLCYYLYFNLGKSVISKRFYKATFSNPATVRTNISKRCLSDQEISELKSILQSMRTYALYHEKPDIKLSSLNEHINSSLDMHDVFASKERLFELQKKIDDITLEYYKKYNIAKL